MRSNGVHEADHRPHRHVAGTGRPPTTGRRRTHPPATVVRHCFSNAVHRARRVVRQGVVTREVPGSRSRCASPLPSVGASVVRRGHTHPQRSGVRPWHLRPHRRGARTAGQRDDASADDRGAPRPTRIPAIGPEGDRASPSDGVRLLPVVVAAVRRASGVVLRVERRLRGSRNAHVPRLRQRSPRTRRSTVDQHVRRRLRPQRHRR